ncbi:MAG TPA: prephenate dehydratase [Armatimonadota bacterium]|nr:prephenate dehydratase [Armatimonadota bacterium]
MSIDDIRREIDELDAAILELLNRRAEKAIAIGRMKEEAEAEVFDPARERRILDRLTAINKGPLTPEALRELYGAVFAVSRLLEKQLAIAYYGPAGSFTHIAARRQFGAGADLRPFDAIGDVFIAVEKKDADFGVVPIENTTAGVVPLTLDAFMESKLLVCAELYVDIEHYLLSRCRALEEIERVYSHPQAIAQCRLWLRANLPGVEIVPVGTTARATELASKEPRAAAIGPAFAGELHDVPALRAKIHDQADNRTRFVVIGQAAAKPSGTDKTSLLFSVPHQAGALHSALGVFSSHEINMTFIQSHPTKQTPWEYMFFVDVQGHRDDPRLSEALGKLRDHTLILRLLGSYPEAQ